MAGCRLRKFRLILWKNFLIQWRHPLQAMVEVVLPLLFALLLLHTRRSTPSLPAGPGENENHYSDEFDPAIPGRHTATAVLGGKYILYAPNNADVVRIMDKLVRPKFNLNQTDRRGVLDYEFRAFENEADLERDYLNNPLYTTKVKTKKEDEEEGYSREINDDPVLAAVIFTSSPNDSEISYRIRFPSRNQQFKNSDETSWLTNQIFPLVGPNLQTGRSLMTGYKTQGFLYLQSALEWALINYRRGRIESSDLQFLVSLNKLPESSGHSRLRDRMKYGHLGLIIAFSYIYPVMNIAKSIALEKERRLKEAMRMMGLPNWLNRTAWFVKAFLILLVSTVLLTLIFKWRVSTTSSGHSDALPASIVNFTNGFLLFAFLAAYMFSVIGMAFLVASFFSKANPASTAAGVIFLLTYIPSLFMESPAFAGLSKRAKLICSLMSNTAMAYGCFIIGMFEYSGKGVQRGTWSRGLSPDQPVSLLHVTTMMVVDGFLYLLLAIYVEEVLPGEFGVPLPWYFPFTKRYWTGGTRSEDGGGGGGSSKVHPEVSEHEPISSFEKEPQGKAGIQIKGLGKTFGKVVAVDRLNLNFYEDQVTALLGHNGAGKTTTMSIITGLYRATSGTATVNSFDIRRDMPKIRKSLGVCPQHNVLFDELTVEEHLKFFCLLKKGYDKGSLKAEVEKTLNSMNFSDKRNAQPHALSGGMKRKLSVGIALVGGSRVVFLDEPTSGMDPGARRSVWELILKEKKGRTIVLSTHFMDEADLLGDRIAIMAHGRVICCGSPLFLKKKYGGGYHLIMVKEPGCQVTKVTELLKKTIPEAELDQNVGTELSYSLPDWKVHLFPDMFDELEERKAELGIASYGCSNIQMEEVFIRVCKEVEEEEETKPHPGESAPPMQTPSEAAASQASSIDAEKGEANRPLSQSASKRTLTNSDPNSVADPEHANPHDDDDMQRNKGLALIFQQLRGMFVKKCHYAWRNKLLHLTHPAVPLTFLVLVLFLSNYKFLVGSPEIDRKLDLTGYTFLGEPVTTIQCSWDLRTAEEKKPSSFHTNNRRGRGTKKKEEHVRLIAISEDLCSTYENVARAESKVVNTGDTMLEEFISAVDPDLAMFQYIVGLKVILSKEIKETPTTPLPDLSEEKLPSATIEKSDVDPDTKGGAGRLTNSGPFFRQARMIGYYNGKALHALPVALNFIHNTILRNVTGDNKLRMRLSHHPLPYRPTDSKEEGTFVPVSDQGFIISFCLTFSMAFFGSSFTIFTAWERVSNAKHLQYVSGAKLSLYWLANMSFDGIFFLACCFLLIGVIVGFQTEVFKEPGVVAATFLTLILYGWAVIPMSYLFSFRFNTPSKGYSILVMFNLFFGIAGIIFGQITIGQGNGGEGPRMLEAVSIFLPQFNFSWALLKLLWGFQMEHSRCEKEQEGNCKDVPVGYLAWKYPGVGSNLLFFFLSGLTFFGLVLLKECSIVRETANSAEGMLRARPKKPKRPPGDSDVVEENGRVRNADLGELCQRENVVLLDLTKYFDKFVAVDRLCLGIEQGECFGLLGVNGAGKTTTFKMLTGDTSITLGDAYVSGWSVKSELKEIHKMMGYCPQFDALIPEMSGREMVRLFARLRGIPEGNIDRLADRLGHDLIFTEHMEKPCGTYSGGNRRKLSTALALIGNPSVVVLDEPTTGLDPVARRHLWKALTKLREGGTSVVLTTHSMEEGEALCTRLAIMVNGSFCCLGSLQHIKDKFGDGFTITAQLETKAEDEEDGPKQSKSKLTPNTQKSSTAVDNNARRTPAEIWEMELEPLRKFIEDNFPGCQLKDMHPAYVQYHIPKNAGISWGQMFKKMEEAKAQLGLEAYSVGQTTLEQVFLGFAKQQSNSPASPA